MHDPICYLCGKPIDYCHCANDLQEFAKLKKRLQTFLVDIKTRLKDDKTESAVITSFIKEVARLLEKAEEKN